jgi:antitoxin (DNA-binding transcriptional repressor) of toxin-antitoxin stability system
VTSRKEEAMRTIPLGEAQTRLAEIIEGLSPGEEVVITRDDEPVAILRAVPTAGRRAPRLGTLKGTVLYVAPDFDDIPEGFEEYVE